ncbi:MAG: glycosyltransferase [Saprospiraceae bacterium]|nr:glycosyltransferase [Saprospiraceae bacterium]
MTDVDRLIFPPVYPSSAKQPTVLVAPLNWGLGHATRCIPIIQALERMNAKVVLASDGSALQLLKAEFPRLPAFHLPSYHIRYATHSMVWNIARQLPRILYAIRAEQWATERLVRSQGINGIISDNRYGCFSRHINSVILTHQIRLRVPNAALQWAANQMLRFALRKFDAVWSPDTSEPPGLSGELSHPPVEGLGIKYLGILSRFTSQKSKKTKMPGKVAVVLSGPEPQRSYLEQILLEQAMTMPFHFVFVKGKTQAKTHHFIAENVEVVSFLTSRELCELLESCSFVVCRSGYSSLMDLAALGNQKALLIPTPGQTEQEYLADRLHRAGVFLMQKQHEVDLASALEQLPTTSGIASETFDQQTFEPILREWLATISR